jgi:hypothetical protein
MSRTYRTKDRAIWFIFPERLEEWEKKRDRKPYFKPNSEFKKVRRRIRRAKEKQALRENKEIPIFKKDDVWDWN